MTSRERFEGFLSRTRIDRVPVQLQNLFLTAQAVGTPFSLVCRDPELVARGHLLEWEKYRHDGVIVDTGTHVSAESMGCGVQYEGDELPKVVSPAIESWDGWRRLSIPDLLATPATSTVLEAVRILKREIGGHAVIIGTVDQGPFTLTTQIAGLEKTLLALATREAEDEIQALLELCAQFTLCFGMELAEAGADVIRMGDSISGTDLISPAMYRAYALPMQRWLAEEFRQVGVVFDFHICGNATPIIADMVSTGAAYVEIDEKTDLAVAREAVRDGCGITGPISPRLLRFGTSREVESSCRDVLTAWMPQGGLFFGPGCALVKDTPEGSLRILMEAARTLGSYSR